MKSPKFYNQLIVTLAFCLLWVFSIQTQAQSVVKSPDGSTFEFGELEAKRASAAREYLPFLNVESLHCGIYSLKAGAKDGQQPHKQDEIYYVESGVAKIQISGEDFDLKKGSIVFVPAHATHHFHSITEDLKTLVFFSKGPVGKNVSANQKDDADLKVSVTAAMTFNTTFDSVTDANLFGSGSGLINTAMGAGRKKVEQGGSVPEASIAKGEGISGDCLRFKAKSQKVLYYDSELAASFSPRPDWSGSISFWLRLDPNKALGDGYCDPIQIAGRKWNDGSIWVDFDDVKPRTFRLGVFSDLDKWNPNGIKWEDFPENERPLVTVKDPPFSANKWTHVGITFSDINSTKNKNATARLYLDGKLQGAIDRKIDMSWNEKTDPPAAIMLGINYVGDMDELSIYSRELTAEEIGFINRTKR